MLITPQNVQLITDWVQKHFPDVQIELTGYDPLVGAAGIYFEVNDLTVEQAYELLTMRKEMGLPFGLWDTKNQCEVSINMQFTRPKSVIH
jgi:hypothetical protein